jgi:hypothetical protein
VALCGRAIKLTVKADIEGLPVTGIDEDEIILSTTPNRQQKEQNNQTELKHILVYYLSSRCPRQTGSLVNLMQFKENVSLARNTFIEYLPYPAYAGRGSGCEKG